MDEGLKGPPTVPEEVNPPAGRTANCPSLLTVSETERDVLPLPVVVLAKLTVSVWLPGTRLFAPALIETVTVVLAPAANVPLAVESVTQLCALVAVQLSDEPPELVSV